MNFFGTSVIDYIFYAIVVLIALGIGAFAAIVYAKGKKARKLLQDAQQAGEEISSSSRLDNPIMYHVDSSLARQPTPHFVPEKLPRQRETIVINKAKAQEQGN